MIEANIPLDDHNKWADFWRYTRGVNVIPADMEKKRTYENWKELQDKPIPDEMHNTRKNEKGSSWCD